MKNKNLFIVKKQGINDLFVNGRQFTNLEKSKFNLEKLISSSYKGVGDRTARKLMAFLGMSPMLKLSHIGLKEEEMQTLLDRLPRKTAKLLLDQTLDRSVDDNIAAKIQSGSYKGYRFLQALPVRGQRTKSNGQTSKRRTKYKAHAMVEENVKKPVKKK